MRTPGKICVLGLGYIGLPTSAILACNGVEVLGVDVDEAVVRAVQAGDVPFAEPDLASFVRRAVDSGRLTAAARPGEAEAYIVAVPTPCGPDHAADLSYVEAAADSIARVLRPGALVLLESTSPPGTTRLVADRVAKARPDLVDGAGRLAVDFAYCPERVLPGQMMKELIGNDRIVGGLTRGAAERAAAVYETFCHGEILRTDAATAELAKLVENSYRDVNIAFANELSVVADSLGVDVWELIGLANHHPRVNILQPGPGVGGHCIAVDPWFIVEAAPAQARLIRAAREVNDAKPAWVCAKAAELLAHAAPAAAAPVIAALGLAFKANVDDLRESPAREVVARLADAFPEGRIRVAEPYVDRLPPELAARPNVELVAADDVFAGADLAVMLVDHAAFARELLPVPEGLPTLDTRGAWK